jgi:hypothetical protein
MRPRSQQSPTGHFCWSCGRTRPNERFSGGGHARHLCKDCNKLGQEELAYRQAVRDIDRTLQWETGRVKRKHRHDFARFLCHPNQRIRLYAESVAARNAVPDTEDECFASAEAIECVWEEEEGRSAG